MAQLSNAEVRRLMAYLKKRIADSVQLSTNRFCFFRTINIIKILL